MNPTALIADAGGVLIIPVFGGLGVAGLFAAAAAVAGGFWLVNRPAAPLARRWFLALAGVACLGGATTLGVFGLFGEPLPGVGAAALAVAAVALFYLASRPVPPDPGEADSRP
ncbi:MAG: hypothetical protein C0501_15040 [Isosphaera sp.]|nr:hypothetical protein [Isosphaera sp.]